MEKITCSKCGTVSYEGQKPNCECKAPFYVDLGGTMKRPGKK